MVAETVEVEVRRTGKRLVDIAQQIDSQQSAAVVRAQRNLAAGVGRNRREALVGIAVGDALADDRIPEQHSRLGRLPCVVDDLVPQLAGIDLLAVKRLVGIYGELLAIGAPLGRGTHEFVVDLYRDVGARDLARIDLGVDEVLGIGVFYQQREHQRTASSVLRHFARRVRITLHERHDTGRGKRRVEHGTARGTYVRQIVSHAAAALHQLHLLLVHAEDAAIRVGGVLMPYDEAVGQRRDLEIVSDTGHRTALRNDVTEMVEQLEYLSFR